MLSIAKSLLGFPSNQNVTQITNWEDIGYKCTYVNFGATTVLPGSLWGRRVGNTLEVRGVFYLGVPDAAPGQIVLPPELPIDFTQWTPASTVTAHCGDFIAIQPAANTTIYGGGNGLLTIASNSPRSIYFTQTIGPGAIVIVNGNTFASASAMSVRFSVPIIPWKIK